MGAPLRWPGFTETRTPPAWLAVLVLCGTSSLLATVVGKDVNWDLFNYHFYNGYAFLTDRAHKDIAPAQLQTFLNPLLDVPLYLAISHLSPIVVGLVYGFVQGFNAVAVWLIGKALLPID